ncbi:antiviral reverse transcriptase Drt3a [Zymomonas mobilis]|uniref:Reverse transcriptase domain-containing protein n=1 Tax=Zymomonas mobilis subsp. pomaceae (strain ATCC 29192 / DSM 22645 / JCM 10191 / CCUG 17912 / NBRC 13757 / NCIMB 11200 / NRRL B-4491 / Barker I) TaxID=579138 RepID=F8EWJ0_ZYMMT|nr:antiviral reverse transcriptase Drt3a [Zymomonas mobilis]AEI38633.1 conserved hypothetical protein [Zymomonas mobilis subsp. pomaceae ATCC 29192]MDX5947822.1 antiviral reverse transcriptase Drt3a [Zymomonas mobilis subsp. pomaceae]GEB90123.1 hypothetical protein ZMO02_17600 [Zymomonas mobilis subsp. pomaceae]
MLDQTFSAHNLRKISEQEKRKGRIRDLIYFKEVKRKTEELKSAIQVTKDFRHRHRGKYSTDKQSEFNIIKEIREEKRKERDDLLLKGLEDVSRVINRKNFEISFTKKSGPNGKPVYVIDKNQPDQLYALKKLEANIAAIYKVRPQNRNQIMDQLIGILSSRFNYHVIRTDITSFFETIPHDRLLGKLKADQLLSQKSMRITEKILFLYADLALTPGKGLPRGLGISSYLSELYMRDFDQKIKSLPDTVFYARYVDDIVILFAPLPGSDVSTKKEEIKNHLLSFSLSMNLKKTEESPLDDDGHPRSRSGWSFEYLGYKLDFGSDLSVTMSKKRLDRYKKRICVSFDRYQSQKTKNSKHAYRLLIKRVRFLTSNTQLTHNKSNAYVGIYFNNRHLNKYKDLKALDNFLGIKIQQILSPSLRRKLNQYSFEAGFKEKNFRRFHKKDEFKEIVKAWKYEK